VNLEFDLDHVTVTEFGVGHDDRGRETFFSIPVDGDVQAALVEIASATWHALEELSDAPVEYEPSEKYASSEYVRLSLGDSLAERMRILHQASNLAVNAAALSDPASVFCYFARMTDRQGRRLTGLRRATQFKGILKSRLIRLVTDSLTLVEDRVFKLDNDFDLLIDNKNLHILRPSGFEFAGHLQKAIMAAVPENIKAIQVDLKFVDFGNVQAYASKHPRAARLLGSIRAQQEATNIHKRSLKRLCVDTRVEIHEAKGKMVVRDDHVIGFLEVLDRRRYKVELVKGSPEPFKAASRRRLAR